ncbi:hypothetical protein GC163_19850 [bacterium]|nr:hypothetical protein [bacterium]
MRDHETAMQTYAELAAISHAKCQVLARDRFVLLTGVEACRAGWLEVANAAYRLHTQCAKGHRLRDFESLPAALRDADFQRIVEQTERWCHHERAEALLRGISPIADGQDQSPGQRVLIRLEELAKATEAEPTSPGLNDE